MYGYTCSVIDLFCHLFFQAIDTLEKYADQKITFTDCVSFVLMKKEGIKRAFSFDFHFRLAGYEVVP